MRPDINDPENRLIIEIKPNTKGGLANGIAQATCYADELGYPDIEVWLYPPGTNPYRITKKNGAISNPPDLGDIVVVTGHNSATDLFP